MPTPRRSPRSRPRSWAEVTRPLRVGVQLPEVEREAPWTEYMAMARAAEEVGFDTVEDAVLLPRPSRRPPLMVGSYGDRVLRATLPHVDVWNAWYEDYGNTAEGFAALSVKVSSIVDEVGRPPGEVERSACLLVAPEGGERPDCWETPPLTGSIERIAAGIRELDDAGADEVILVVTPITERSIRTLGEALLALDASRTIT